METCYDCMGKWISVLHRQFQVYLNKQLKPYGMNSSEFIYILTLFSKEEGMSQDELAQALFIDKAAVARSVKSLEQKGFISRRQDSQNHRIKRVFLTQKAIDFAETLRKILDNWDNRLKETVGKSDYQVIVDGLYSMSMGVLEKRLYD